MKEFEIIGEKDGGEYANESISNQKEMRLSSGSGNTSEYTMGMIAGTDQNSNNYTKIEVGEEIEEDQERSEEETGHLTATLSTEEEEQAQGVRAEQAQLQDPTEGAVVALSPTMSKEEVLLLQVLRRAKRQQDLIVEVQKSLKILSSIEKITEKTTVQIKQLQAAVKTTQKEVTQTQRQISGLERAQEKAFKRINLSKQKARTASTNKPKVQAGKGRKSGKSKRRQ